MECINSSNFDDYIYNFDSLTEEQLELLNIAINFSDIKDDNSKKKIVFCSRNGKCYDNLEEFIDANRKYCNAITTVKGDNNKEYFTSDDVIENNIDYWKNMDLKFSDDDNALTFSYYVFHLNELSIEELNKLKFMFKYLKIGDVQKSDGIVEREFYFLGRNGKKYFKINDFIEDTKKYCFTFNKFKSDNSREFYAFDDVIEDNKDYWRELNSKINLNGNNRTI